MRAAALTVGMREIYPPDLNQYGLAIVHDPYDLDTLFQDSAGTTPVTGVEQPVGLMLDKGPGGYHFSQPTSGSRPKLRALWNMLVGSDSPAPQNVTTLATDYTLSFSGTGTITLSGTATGVLSAGTNTFTATAGTLTLTVSGTVTNAQLIATNMAHLPYQSVTNSTTYDADPSKFPWYLEHTNHWMVTPSIDASTWDKVVVACGISKMNDAAFAVFMEMSVNTGVNTGVFALFAPVNTINLTGFSFRSKGTSAEDINITSGFSSPISAAIVCAGDITNDVCKTVANGVTAFGADDQGTGNYGNYPLYLGKRAGTTAPFVGRYMGSTVAFVTALPSQIILDSLSRYYAQKAGIRI